MSPAPAASPEPTPVSSVEPSEPVITAPKPGEIWREPATGMAFVWIPGGCIRIGSPLSEAGRRTDEDRQRVCVEGPVFRSDRLVFDESTAG